MYLVSPFIPLCPPTSCVYSNSRNDVPRVAQWYGTIAAHTRRRASILVVFVVFCMHMYSFAGLIRRTPQLMFSDTATTNRHSDTTIFQLRAHWCGYPGLLDRKIGTPPSPPPLHTLTTTYHTHTHTYSDPTKAGEAHPPF